MCRLVIVVMLLLYAGQAAALDQTPGQGASGRGHFGAPVVKYIVVRDQGAVMLGGRGGWNITPSLVLGGGLYAMMSGVGAREGAVPHAPGPLDVKLESFGFDLEYAIHPAAPAHLTMSTFLGGVVPPGQRGGAARAEGERSQRRSRYARCQVRPVLMAE